MNSRSCSAFTWVEALVGIAVAGVLLFVLALPVISSSCPGSGSTTTATLRNMRHLQLATQSMALDGVTQGDTNLAWPGSQNGTFSDWASKIVPEYLSKDDFCRYLSVKDMKVDPRRLPTENRNPVLVYAVTEDDGGSHVFLTTANFTNTPAGGRALRSDAKPYGDKVFVVFRKGGDGGIFLPKQAGDSKLIGNYAPLLR